MTWKEVLDPRPIWVTLFALCIGYELPRHPVVFPNVPALTPSPMEREK